MGFTPELLAGLARRVPRDFRAEPAWLSGVVYGPQVRVSLPELRKAVPRRYPIRDYPDITHSLRCQYAVPDWDVAYSLTEGREVINPRPRDEATIFHAFADQTIGFITYSEGCNDDVNKTVWSALGWDPRRRRPRSAAAVQPLLYRRRIGRRRRLCPGTSRPRAKLARPAPHQHFGRNDAPAVPRPGTAREARSASELAFPASSLPRLLRRVRTQSLDLRDRPRAASDHPPAQSPAQPARLQAIEQAEAILDRAISQPIAADLRARVFALGEALFQSIRMQLSVPLYKAIHFGRGATLDTIDVPLNNRNWLKTRFDVIRKLETEEARQRELDAIVNWTNPGPGGFYDDLGDPLRRPHLVFGSAYEKDPAFLHGPQTGFDWEHDWRRAWCRHAGALVDETLRMHYSGLDPTALYKLRIVYTGDMFQAKVRLVAGESLEVHPYLLKPRDMKPLEFDLPLEATGSGVLDLTWHAEKGRGGNGRGCQVSEVWLIKRQARD